MRPAIANSKKKSQKKKLINELAEANKCDFGASLV
ncbi:hypothetical protein MPLSOD_40299 [Mesorhizobium sp. SOD10]|nr:hypothetical protein MPLSOD_40299 [Mesorhizobium sp. SOD10]